VPFNSPWSPQPLSNFFLPPKFFSPEVHSDFPSFGSRRDLGGSMIYALFESFDFSFWAVYFLR